MNREIYKEDIDKALLVFFNSLKEQNIHLNFDKENELWHCLYSEINEFFEYPKSKL